MKDILLYNKGTKGVCVRHKKRKSNELYCRKKDLSLKIGLSLKWVFVMMAQM